MESLPLFGALAIAVGVGILTRARRTPRPVVSRIVGTLAVVLGALLIVLPLLRGHA